jgi:hypothetical protein
VSVKKNPNFYVFLGKKYLETHETIELHALGNAVSTSVIASENLVRYVYLFPPFSYPKSGFTFQLSRCISIKCRPAIARQTSGEASA